MRKLDILIFFLFLSSFLSAQSYYFGPKLGTSIGFQRWENFQQSPLFSYHGAFFIESYSEENEMNSLFAQLGWHNRGSAYRNQRIINIGDGLKYTLPTKNFIFSNVVLGVGAKRKQSINKKLNSYYSIGLRGEYTAKTNLDEYAYYNSVYGPAFYPDDDFVRKFNYGIIVGGGFEYIFGDMVAGILDISINPDLSRQYEQPPIPNVRDPWTGSLVTTRQRRIKNITLEISLGLRLFRKVIYLDY